MYNQQLLLFSPVAFADYESPFSATGEGVPRDLQEVENSVIGILRNGRCGLRARTKAAQAVGTLRQVSIQVCPDVLAIITEIAVVTLAITWYVFRFVTHRWGTYVFKWRFWTELGGVLGQEQGHCNEWTRLPLVAFIWSHLVVWKCSVKFLPTKAYCFTIN